MDGWPIIIIIIYCWAFPPPRSRFNKKLMARGFGSSAVRASKDLTRRGLGDLDFLGGASTWSEESSVKEGGGNRKEEKEDWHFFKVNFFFSWPLGIDKLKGSPVHTEKKGRIMSTYHQPHAQTLCSFKTPATLFDRMHQRKRGRSNIIICIPFSPSTIIFFVHVCRGFFLPKSPFSLLPCESGCDCARQCKCQRQTRERERERERERGERERLSSTVGIIKERGFIQR